MNQPKTFTQRLKWIGILSLLLIATYPIGFYLNAQKLAMKIKASQLPKVRLNLSRLRFKMPHWSPIKIGSTSH